MTLRQQAFIDEYMIDLNATQAAIRAGYAPKTARITAANLLAKSNIQDAIAVRSAERARRTGINADRVLMELGQLAFYSPGDVVNLRKGELYNCCSKDELKVITKTRVKRTTRNLKDGTEETVVETEFTFADRLKALELIMRHLGMDKPKQESQLDGTYGVVLLPPVGELPPPPSEEEEEENA